MLKKGDNYSIIFADPKSTKYTDYEYKVDGYRFIFEEGQDKKDFKKDGLNIRVYLKLYTEDEVPEGYKAYWFANPKDIITGINL